VALAAALSQRARRRGAGLAPRHRPEPAAAVRATRSRRDRARERLRLPIELAEDEAYAAVDERLSVDERIADALDALPAHEREAVDLRVLRELPYDDVARTLHIRPAAARLRVSRALRRLALSNPEEKR